MSNIPNDRPASYWLDTLKTTETADHQWKKAVNALASMGLRAVPALIEATGDEHPEVRRGANQALHEIGPAIVPFLTKALKHGNSSVRESAARGLYGFAPHAQGAIPALTDAVQDFNVFVRQWVAMALGELGRLFGPLLKMAVPGLANLLKDEDCTVREWSAHALGFFGVTAEPAIPALEAALKDEDSSVREAVAMAIRDIQKGR